MTRKGSESVNLTCNVKIAQSGRHDIIHTRDPRVLGQVCHKARDITEFSLNVFTEFSEKIIL